MVNKSPSHIYHSALPLSPSKSWLRECYSLELSKVVKVVKGLPAEWGICSRTVSFDQSPHVLTCLRDLIAVGFSSGKITILDAITGICKFVLSGHTEKVNSLTFSLDGTLLASGSDDTTAILWDIQTGGIVKTFHGHTSLVSSVSISPDGATVASGAADCTIRLWDTQTLECCCVIDEDINDITTVTFSPTNSQLLISASNDSTIQQWDINGHQIGPTYEGNYVGFSSDGAYFVSCEGVAATVRSSGSGVVVTKLQTPGDYLRCCCFSLNGKLVAGAASYAIHIWDIASLEPHLVKTSIRHTNYITSLTYSSSLISCSGDQTMKFWQIDTLLMDLAASGSESAPLALASVQFVGLDTNNGVAISTDSAGVVRTWDLSTGLCRASFHAPTDGFVCGDAQLVNGRLTLVWLTHSKICIWDSEKGGQTVDKKIVDKPATTKYLGLKISGDGSKVFLLEDEYIQALSIQTGEATGWVKLKGRVRLGSRMRSKGGSLVVDGSRAWVYFNDAETMGWDFGVPGSIPIPLPNVSLGTHRLAFIEGTMGQSTCVLRVEDTVTKAKVFWLYGEYTTPSVVQWDGQCLIAGYNSGEILILDFKHVIPQ